MKKRTNGVFSAIRMAAMSHHLLTVGTILCVAASVVASLLPPLLLARIIDGLTAGIPLTFVAVLLYFGSLALEGVLTSAQETLLEILGQKMTHALRAEMSRKLSRLPAGTLAEQNPGEVAARFSGDVDTVEALFTSGIISMVADACRILSIMAVIAVKNTGLALILLLVLPLFAVFTRHVQKRMLAAQLDHRRAVAAVCGGEVLRDVPFETFIAKLPECRKQCGDRAVLRAFHIYADNDRVAKQVTALREGDFTTFLNLVGESGQSSWEYLQNVIPAGYKEHQEVAVTIAAAKHFLGGKGAVRVHGGGFAGTVQAFVPVELLAGFKANMEAILGEGRCHVLSIRPEGGAVL